MRESLITESMTSQIYTHKCLIGNLNNYDYNMRYK
jgi:hypothetical protein